jgi:hypothetical protein
MAGGDAARPAPTWLRALAIVAVVAALLSAAWAAWAEGETYDEATHLEWSRRLLETGETERLSSPQYNAKTPVNVLNVLARKAAKGAGVRDPQTLRLAARFPTVLWLAALLAAAFALARAWLGTPGAVIATVLLALDPNLVAHGSLVTVDLPYAVATVLALYALAGFAVAPSSGRGALLGLALGLAFSIKFTAVLLLACVAVAPFALGVRPRAAPIVRGLACAAAVAAVVVSSAYLLHGVGGALRDAPWKSDAFRWLEAAVPGLRLPVPLDFLTGIDSALASERGKPWNVILLGRLHPDGVWYYFGVVWALKTPLAILFALATGMVAARRAILAPGPLRLVAAALAVHIVYFSFVFRTQIGFRYVLMCVPLAALLAARGLARGLASPRALVVAALLVALTLAETLPYGSDPIAFTNAIVRPKRDAFRYLADSNVDWGQNDDAMPEWLAAHGIDTQLNPAHILPGHNTIDLNLLAGVAAFDRHRWAREHLEPRGHFRFTHPWFDVTPQEFDRFMGEARTLDVEPAAAESCRKARYAPLVAGAGQPVPAPAPAPDDDSAAPTACVRAAETVDVQIAATAGSATIVRAGRALRDGERLWASALLRYRLQPGVHAFAFARARGLAAEVQALGPGVELGFAPAGSRPQ